MYILKNDHFNDKILHMSLMKGFVTYMKISEFFSQKKSYMLLFLLIALQLVYFTYVFAYQREGVHSDENWSYGYANAYYQKQLYCDEEGNRTNFNTWTDSQVFRNYIEVSEDQRFSYGSIRFNMEKDFNPPLHSILLHTICSFFPDSFSWWYAYLINIPSLIMTMIFLYLLGRELTHSDSKALFICFLYGSLSGALSTFIYLRTYALLTALAVLYTLIHCRMYNRSFQKPFRCLAGILLLNIMGGLSHYYFLALVFCFAVIFSIYLLFTRRFKTFLFYAATMFLSAGIYLLIWPQALHLIFGSSGMYSQHMKLIWEFKTCLQYLIGESTGVLILFPNPYSTAIFNVCLIFLTIITAGLSFLFRSESWFRRWIRRIRLGVRHFFRRMPGRIKKSNKLYPLLILIYLATLLIIAEISNIYIMGIYFDRYIFFLMPAATVLTVGLLSRMLSHLLRRARSGFRAALFIVLTCCCFGINQLVFPCKYLFPRNSDSRPTEELTREANVITAVDNDWHIVCYSTLLRNSRQFYMLNIETLEDSLDGIEDLGGSPDAPVYLIIETSRLHPKHWKKDESAPEGVVPADEILMLPYTSKDILDRISTHNFSGRTEYITTESGFVGTYEIYRLR